jgi:hypothetical protein
MSLSVVDGLRGLMKVFNYLGSEGSRRESLTSVGASGMMVLFSDSKNPPRGGLQNDILTAFW